MRPPATIAATLVAAAFAATAHASDVRIVGNVAVTPNLSATYATISADRVQNFDLFGYSGTLRLEYWAFSYPYNGSAQVGYQMAVATLGQLNAGYYLYGISHYVPLAPPPYGYYCPSLHLTEYTFSGYVTRDWVTFSCRYIGSPPVYDFDADGWTDLLDNCPLTWNPSQSNADGDLLGDACDSCPSDSANDADGDGRCANQDNCPSTANASQANSDGDALGDACDVCPYDSANDSDHDGFCANADNCLNVSNPTQSDADQDQRGDACDSCPLDAANDSDGDGRCANLDNCPLAGNPEQLDSDGDGRGDVCDVCVYDSADDLDKDGVCADADNCPVVSNAEQGDWDGDSHGDACDQCVYDAANDIDGDGSCANEDNCPLAYNQDQLDSDGDSIGDICDPTPVPEAGSAVSAGMALLTLLSACCVRAKTQRRRPGWNAQFLGHRLMRTGSQ